MSESSRKPKRWPRTLPDPCEPLRGLRRTMSREDFESLCFYQCRAEEICGYAGVSREKLAAWVRRAYRMGLEDILPMLHQDGLIEIRKAAFDCLKKSTTLINQQYNRFIPVLPPESNEGQAAMEALMKMLEPDADPENEEEAE